MVHIKVWVGSARIIDMTNACKVGKRCAVLRVSGVPWDRSNNETADQVRAREAWERIAYGLESLNPEIRHHGAIVPRALAEIGQTVRALVEDARTQGVPEHDVAVHDESIRGIDAPRVRLTAGVEGKWGGGADESGIAFRQYDDINEWSEITHDQTGPQAYKLAAKVWDRVKRAQKMSEAVDILRQAGCRLHGYCAMD